VVTAQTISKQSLPPEEVFAVTKHQERPRTRLFSVLAILLLAGSSQAGMTFDLHFGTSAKPPTTLEITQAGHADAVITGVHFETRPWEPFATLALITQNYYGFRIGHHARPASDHSFDLGIELELLHDKAYYVSGNDPEQVVQHFELSDGVNYLLLNGVARYPVDVGPGYPNGRTQLLVRAGAGPVITAPASTIRRQGHGHDLHGTGEAYEFAGFGYQLAAQARQFILPALALSLEGKYTYSSPSQSIANGRARTYLPTVHINVGLSFAPGW
jgi:hypothetical protein